MNDYLLAQDGMKKMIRSEDDPMETFKKKSYPVHFQSTYEEYLPVMDAIERVYTSVAEPDTFLDNMASALVETAKERMDAQTKKTKKETLLLQLNMRMAVYVFPVLLQYKGTSSQPLVDKILQKWKEAFPKTNLQAADYEFIQNGFKRKFCYITTAVCETFDKPDDCYELTLLRNYRDEYMASRPDGEEMIRSYYDVAPTIVKHIDRRDDSAEIYRGIWQEYLSPCITMIEDGRKEECMRLYIKMVQDLKQDYFLS